MEMELFRYSRSLYGGDETIIGASWDLLGWFVSAALVFIVAHALFKATIGKRIVDTD